MSEAALLAAMAYADLNPVRAGLAERIEACRETLIAERLRENSAEALEAYLAPLVSGLDAGMVRAMARRSSRRPPGTKPGGGVAGSQRRARQAPAGLPTPGAAGRLDRPARSAAPRDAAARLTPPGPRPDAGSDSRTGRNPNVAAGRRGSRPVPAPFSWPHPSPAPRCPTPARLSNACLAARARRNPRMPVPRSPADVVNGQSLHSDQDIAQANRCSSIQAAWEFAYTL